MDMGETAQQLLCMAASSGLIGSNPTCTAQGLPENFFVQLITWGPMMLTLGIVVGVPLASFIVLKAIDVISGVTTRT